MTVVASESKHCIARISDISGIRLSGFQMATIALTAMNVDSVK